MSYQSKVQEWVVRCFGQAVADNMQERNHRFLEEALELVQALGCTKEEALALVDYVYVRPEGVPDQEVGGVMVTLASLCETHNINMVESGDRELQRVWNLIPQIRSKQANKPKGPLPTVNEFVSLPKVEHDRLLEIEWMYSELKK